MATPATQSATASSSASGAEGAPAWTPPNTKTNKVTFDDNGKPKVYSLASNTVDSLAQWLDNRGQGVEDDEASLIVLDRKFKHVEEQCVRASLALMQKLVRHCGIPREIMDYIMKYEVLGSRPISATDWSLQQSPRTWHAVTVPTSPRRPQFEVCPQEVDQVMVFQMPALVGGATSPVRSGPLNILLVVDPEAEALFQRASKAVQASRGQFNVQDTLNILYGHLLVHLEEAVGFWSVNYLLSGGSTEFDVAQVEMESKGILTPEAFTILDTAIYGVEVILDGIRRLEATAVYVSKLFAPAAERNMVRMENLERMDGLLALIRCGIQTLERRHNWSMIRKGTIVETVHVNNNRLARENIIELCRIAQQNRKDGAVFQKLSFQVAQDSRQMKRLAYLNMAFLPSAMAAAFFSTPFMALDDTMSFKALGKLWMFFLLAGILTVATFAISAVWDRLEHGGMSSRLGPDGNMEPSGEEAVEGSSRRHLEPEEQPVFIDHRKKILGSALQQRSPSDKDEDADGSSPAQNGAMTSGVELVIGLGMEGEGNGAGTVRRRG